MLKYLAILDRRLVNCLDWAIPALKASSLWAEQNPSPPTTRVAVLPQMEQVVGLSLICLGLIIGIFAFCPQLHRRHSKLS